MATNFPTSLDVLTNPTGSSSLTSPDHAAQHTNANDAIEAIEAQIGTTASPVLARLASPTFTGTPTLPTGTIATTQTAADSSTKVATTAFVTTADNLKANIASPTFTGNLTVDTDTLFVDGSTNKVGIGTVTPGVALDVVGSVEISSDLSVQGNATLGASGGVYVNDSTQKVGIYNSSPSYTLDVNHSASNAWGAMRVLNAGTGYSFLVEDATGGDTTPFVIANDGKTGIGTASPSTALAVQGTAVTVTNQTGTIATFGTTTSGRLLVGSVSGTLPFIGSEGDTALHLTQNSVPRLSIAVGGDVGIGVNAPSSKFEVAGTATAYALIAAQGTVIARTGTTKDAVELAGRAGGTGSFKATLTPTTLTADRTLTLPDTSGKLAVAFKNASVSTVSSSYATGTHLDGSAVTIPAGGWTAGTTYRCVFDMVKTAAGTGAFAINVRMGTTGSILFDSIITTLTFGAGTAAVDTGLFEVLVNFRTVGSGTSAVIRATASCNHSLAATGLISTGASGFGLIGSTSAGFDSTTQTILSLSVNGGTNFSGTNNLVQASLELA